MRLAYNIIMFTCKIVKSTCEMIMLTCDLNYGVHQINKINKI